MNYSRIISVLIGLYIAVLGVMMMVRGQLVGSRNRASEKYTEASVKKYCRVGGIFYILGGLLFAAGDALEMANMEFMGLPSYAYMAMGGGVLLVGLILWPIMLKKKDAADVTQQASTKTDDNYIDED